MNPRTQCRRSPPRRSRWRTLLKWSGTLACLLILIAAAACFRWQSVTWANRSWDTGICAGSVYFVSFDGRSLSHPLGIGALRYGAQPGIARWWWAYGAWPKMESSSRRLWISVPLWIPFVLIGLPAAWLWWRDRRRVAAGCCAACGYDLTGNVSGRCPECGALREVGRPKSEV